MKERAGADSTVRLTTAQAIVRFLEAQWTEFDGVRRRLFRGTIGLFGHGNVVGLGQALDEYGADLPFYQAKNEQSGVHMAIGYAKASNRLSTLACITSIGPGSTNLVTGAATATANRIPVLLIPADTFSRRRQGPVLQQIEDPVSWALSVNDSLIPVSRFFDRIAHPEQLLSALPEACRVLTSPAETGAVTVSVHQDTEGEAWDFPRSFFEPRVWTVDRQPAPPEQIRRAVDLITTAERPFVIAGGGVRYSEAGVALAEFAERFGVPIGETFAGKGAVPMIDEHCGGVGVTGTGAANAMASNADLVLSVGTRLQDFTTGSMSLFQNPEVRFMSINVAARDANKLGGLPVTGDARAVIEALSTALADAGWATSPEYRSEVTQRRQEWYDAVDRHLQRPAGERISQGEVLRALNASTEAGDVVVAAAGSPPADLHKLWDHTDGSEAHIEFGFSCMGHEIPAAIGYRMARGSESEIFVVMGEGTWLLGNPEIVTAIQEGFKVTIVLVTNDGYQSIRNLQEAKTGHLFGTELRRRDDGGRLDGDVLPVDFVANAASLGCLAIEATDVEAFETALGEARVADRSVVIVCPVEPYRMLLGGDCWWDVGIAETSERLEMIDIRDEHLKERDAQRYYYAGATRVEP